MKNFRRACTIFALCTALISGGSVHAWAQPPEYIPSPIDPSTFPKPSPEVAQMVKQWEEPFLKLKSLQLSMKAFILDPKGDATKQPLLSETFVYDNPKFREDVTIYKDGVVLNESYGKTTFSYDGHYYYSVDNGPAPGRMAVRALEVDANWPVVSLNPLNSLFRFVINDTHPKNFTSLTTPSVWDDFARRITDFKKDAHAGEVTFSCKNYNSKYMPTSAYAVKADIVDGVLLPVSMSQTDLNDSGWSSEITVTDFAKDAKSTFGMPFPIRITEAPYHKGVLIQQAQTVEEIDAKSLTINQPVTATFTLTDSSMEDMDSLGAPPERK